MTFFSASITTIIFILLGSYKLKASGECWYLEMPKKHAEYLMNECSKADHTKYDKAIMNLPKFIKKGIIKQIEICNRLKGENEQMISGKIHPIVEKKLPDNTVHYNGAFYSSYQDIDNINTRWNSWGEFNLNPPMTNTEQPLYKIKTCRKVSKKWSPTFVKYEGSKCYVLLERDLHSTLNRPVIKSHLTVIMKNPILRELKLVWLVPFTEFPHSFVANYIDTTNYFNKDGQQVDDEGINLQIMYHKINNQKRFSINIWHTHLENKKRTTHHIKLKKMPKEKLEFEFMVTNDGLIKDEGKQGSLEVTLTPTDK